MSCVYEGPGGEIRSTGFNGLDASFDDSDPFFRVKPYKKLAHCAENWGSKNALAMGTSVKGSTLHALWCCCDKCAARAIEDQVGAVVITAQRSDFFLPDWGQKSVTSIRMLNAAGIPVRLIDANDPNVSKWMGCDVSRIMARCEDTPAVPSNTTDWPRRYLEFGAFLKDLGGSGHIIVHPDEKVIRAIGYSASYRKFQAVEAAERSGVPISGCILYAPDLNHTQALQRAVASGITKIVTTQRRDIHAIILERQLSVPIESTWTPPVTSIGSFLERRNTGQKIVHFGA